MSRPQADAPKSRMLAEGTALAALVALAVGTSPARTQEPGDEAVRWTIEQLIDEILETGGLRVDRGVVVLRPRTLSVYERSDFRPLWDAERWSDDESEAAAESLLRALSEVRADGLDPESYHASLIARASAGRFDVTARATLDILRTDAFVAMSQDLRSGRARGAGYGRTDAPDADAAAEILEIVESKHIREALSGFRPRRAEYDALQRGLAALEDTRRAGGWVAIPAGPLLAPGDREERVGLVRTRLAAENYRATAVLDADVFDSALEAAVRAFQTNRGLESTGTIDESTLAALNVPVDELIDRVRVNLERLRWAGDAFPGVAIEVDAAGPVLRVLDGNAVVLETRAIGGTPATPTPLLAADITQIVLNPTWTVPPGIVGEVLAAVRRDPTYLARQEIAILDAAGREVDPASVDLSRYTAANFPYRFRQAAGPLNPLGRIKLVMPNPYFVYLHDTPARDRFAARDRFLSHGCVRVEEPFALAELLLGAGGEWNRVTLEAAAATGGTRTIPLPAAVPVRILYRTAGVAPDGRLFYRRDVYGLDAPLLHALDGDGR